MPLELRRPASIRPLSFQKNFCKTSRRFDYLSPRLLQLCLSRFASETNRSTAVSTEQCSSARSEKKKKKKKRKRDHITPLPNELHCLPVKFRCEYKIATLAYRHIDGTLPSYLSASLCTYQTSRTLRSSNEKLLKIPKRNLRSVGDRSFCFIAPTVWNPMPASLRNLPILSDFKAQFKTFLFQQAFPQV